jgi:hypothetical protein
MSIAVFLDSILNCDDDTFMVCFWSRNVLRMTKLSQLESTNEAADNNTTTTTFLGKKEKDFEFAHLLLNKVEFAESSAVNVDPEKPVELEALEKWLTQIA